MRNTGSWALIGGLTVCVKCFTSANKSSVSTHITCSRLTETRPDQTRPDRCNQNIPLGSTQVKIKA